MQQITELFMQRAWLILLVIPLGLAVWYVLANRVNTVEFSNPEFEQDVYPSFKQWPRRVAVGCLLIGITALPLVVARPMINSTTAEDRTTVMVVLDVSTSMTATDVEPSRLAAAKAAIADAVANSPEQLNIGLITLAGSAQLVSAPSQNHSKLLNELTQLKPQGGGTATGEGVFVAINSLDLVQDFGGDSSNFNGSIILISDGKEEIEQGQRNLQSATKSASQAGYTVSAVNFGTPDGKIDGQPIRSDPASLQAAAKATGGSFYAAGSADELLSALDAIQSQTALVTTKQPVSEQVAWFALGLMALLVAGFITGFIIDRR